MVRVIWAKLSRLASVDELILDLSIALTARSGCASAHGWSSHGSVGTRLHGTVGAQGSVGMRLRARPNRDAPVRTVRVRTTLSRFGCTARSRRD